MKKNSMNVSKSVVRAFPLFDSNHSTPDNSTQDIYLLPGLVTFCTYMGTLTFILSVTFNCLVVTAFRRKPSLITPFTIQFLNFVIINLCTLFYDGPMNILCFMDSTLFRQPVFCAFYKFGAWTFPSLGLLQQMAIGLDRWSALLAPVWRRTKTVKYGARVTLGIVGVYLALYLPLFIVDSLNGVPKGARCDFHHALGAYQHVIRFMTFYVPLLFTYLSYPLLIILIHVRRQAKIRDAAVKRRSMHAGNHRPSHIRSTQVDHYDKDDLSMTNGTRTHGRHDSVDDSGTGTQTDTSKMATIKRRRPKKRSKLNLSMWMMFVQILCSMPLTVTYTMIQYGSQRLRDRNPYLNDVNVVSILLVAINILIDPIIYLVFFEELRAETAKLVRCHLRR